MCHLPEAVTGLSGALISTDRVTQLLPVMLDGSPLPLDSPAVRVAEEDPLQERKGKSLSMVVLHHLDTLFRWL